MAGKATATGAAAEEHEQAALALMDSMDSTVAAPWTMEQQRGARYLSQRRPGAGKERPGDLGLLCPVRSRWDTRTTGGELRGMAES